MCVSLLKSFFSTRVLTSSHSELVPSSAMASYRVGNITIVSIRFNKHTQIYIYSKFNFTYIIFFLKAYENLTKNILDGTMAELYLPQNPGYVTY